jgi:hypothetical protein
LQESRKRKYNSNKRGDRETNEGNIIGAVNVADDIRMINALKRIPQKKFTYSEEDFNAFIILMSSATFTSPIILPSFVSLSPLLLLSYFLFLNSCFPDSVVLFFCALSIVFLE